MYESQFSLKRRPFAATPDPKCFLSSGVIQAALDELVVCVEQGQGVAIVSAPAGTGKTLLCERLRLELETQFRVVILRHASFMTRRALLQSILADLDHVYRRHDEQELRLELVPAIRALNPSREALVLICDEAHMLSEDLLEELRILSDLAENGCPLVRLILVGQPGLEETLALPGLEALNQRIRAHVCLESFDRAGCLDYIDYRITWAGGRTAEVFTPEALSLISHASDGVPRCINQLCDHSLLLAYVAEQSPVTEETVRDALHDLRQLPLHWNESMLAERTVLGDSSESSRSGANQISVDHEVPPGEVQSLEFGADLIDDTPTEVPFASGLNVEFEPADQEDTGLGVQREVPVLAGSESELNQATDDTGMMSQKPPQLETQTERSVPNLRSGEVIEEIVWDRYLAIDGGFPLPQPSQGDTVVSRLVRAENHGLTDPSEFQSVPMSNPPEPCERLTGDLDSFQQACARLNDLLPTTSEVAAWDSGGPEFSHPVSLSEPRQSDDWDSLEAELGMAVCELTSEVHADLHSHQRQDLAVQNLQQMLQAEPINNASFETGVETVSEPDEARSSEENLRTAKSVSVTARPYRNLFSQLRRKQQGLL